MNMFSGTEPSLLLFSLNQLFSNPISLPCPLQGQVTHWPLRLNGALTHAYLKSFLPFFPSPATTARARGPWCSLFPSPSILRIVCLWLLALNSGSAQSPPHSLLGPSLMCKLWISFLFFSWKNMPWRSDEAISAVLPWIPKWLLILMLFLSSLDIRGRESSSFLWLHYVFTVPNI